MSAKSISVRPAFMASATMAARSLRISTRNVDAILTSVFLPVMLMLMFVYLFGGAIETGGDYVTYVVPGVLLLCAGFGSSLTAVSVSQDMSAGIIDRFRSLDLGAMPILSGHVVASLARNLLSMVLVFSVALAIGFHPSAGPLEWLGAIGILALFVVAITWMSAAFGLLAKSAEAAGGFTFAIMFLPYLSSAFVPVETMPGWLQVFARHQPVTPIIESIRALLLGTSAGNDAWFAIIWCLAILVAAVALARMFFRLRTDS